jgi:predicted amidohydrolase YtcJ
MPEMTDLILFNANIITMDPSRPFAELIAVDGGRITFVGNNEMLGSLKSDATRVVDCFGKTLLPGFIDAHCHIHAFAEGLVSLNLSPGPGNIRSIPDMQNRILDFCKRLPEGTWIRGKGYNEFYLAEKRHPNRWDLDAVSPRHPVKLTHRSGHAHVLNTLALNIAGIGPETGDPPEGLIDRDLKTGLPTGILYGLGKYLAGKIPSLEDVEMERGAEMANEKLLSLGITSLQDASFTNGPEQWKRFQMWKARGIFMPRITMMTGLNDFSAAGNDSCFSDADPDELRVGGVKIIADEVTGSLHPSQEELNAMIASIHAAGRQAAVHAIEETVIEAAANAIEFTLKGNPRKDHRHRIEHCSVCPPGLLQRLARLGTVIVTQPGFLYYSGERYLQTLPKDQLDHLYPVRSMLENGLRVGIGSDFPIADPNPMVSICAAVTRRTENGSTLPQQGIRILDAIRMHTLDAAAANFEEQVKGSLTPGKLADMVLLNENPFSVYSADIKDIEVIMTVLGGGLIRDSRFEIRD